AVVVLWSKSSAPSEWVRSEANRAREAQKLVQVRTDDVRLPMPFDQIQCADLTRWHGAARHPGWSQVLRSVDTLTAGGEAGLLRASVGRATGRSGALIGFGAVAVAGAAGVAGWKFWPSREISPEAQLYLQKGMDELQ